MTDDVTEPRRGRPSLYALGIVVILTALGVGLFVWGPVNPNVTVAIYEEDGGWINVWATPLLGVPPSHRNNPSVDSDGRATIDVLVTNHSFAPVDLVEVRLESLDGDETPVPTVQAARGVPARVGHDASKAVSVTLDARAACDTRNEATFRLIFDARTASGFHRAITENGRQSITCNADALPAAGPGPVDPDAARAEIENAFAVAYDFDASPAQSRGYVDDADGLDRVVERAMAGPYGSIVGEVAPRVSEIVFTSPTEAAVLYDVGPGTGSLGTGRVGAARLVDGRWKITRATVCADLSLAEAPCPTP